MKGLFKMLFGATALLGVSYLTWRVSGMGKRYIISWLIQKWTLEACAIGKQLDKSRVTMALQQMEYEQLELLYFYTKHDLSWNTDNEEAWSQKTEQYISRLIKSGIFRDPKLSKYLEGILYLGEPKTDKK